MIDYDNFLLTGWLIMASFWLLIYWLWQVLVDRLICYQKLLLTGWLIITGFCWLVNRAWHFYWLVDYNYVSFVDFMRKKKKSYLLNVNCLSILLFTSSVWSQLSGKSSWKQNKNTTYTAKQTQQPSPAIHLHFHFCVSLFAISCVEMVRFIMHVRSSRAYISLLISFIYLST